MAYATWVTKCACADFNIMATHVFKLFYRPVLLTPKGSLSGYLRPSVGRRGLSEGGNSHTEEGGEEERAGSRTKYVELRNHVFLTYSFLLQCPG